MTRQEILTTLYRSGFVQGYARQLMAKTLKQADDADIMGELWLYICEIPAEKLSSIVEGCGMPCLHRYISGLIYRQLVSDNSHIYWKYTRHRQRMAPLPEYEKTEG